jgi:hypothetical protein
MTAMCLHNDNAAWITEEINLYCASLAGWHLEKTSALSNSPHVIYDAFNAPFKISTSDQHSFLHVEIPFNFNYPS